MNIINGILLLTLVAFLKFKHADGIGNILPDETVVIEMKDGSVFSGGVRTVHANPPLPTWILHTEQSNDGTIRVFIRLKNGMSMTANLTERRSADRHAPILPQHIHVKGSVSRRIVAKTIKFFDRSEFSHTELAEHNLIFIAMEDGTVFYGNLAQ